jgi:hypothetical protein
MIALIGRAGYCIAGLRARPAAQIRISATVRVHSDGAAG